MSENLKLTRLADVKMVYPKLKTICFVGRGGTGKTTVAKETANKLHAPAYLLDNPIIRFYLEKRDLVGQILKQEPNYSNENEAFAFHVAHGCKNEKTLLAIMKQVRILAEKMVSQDIVERQTKKNNDFHAENKDGWLSGFAHKPQTVLNNNLAILDSFTPGRDVLEQMDEIYWLSTHPEEVAIQATVKRENTPPEMVEKITHILKMANNMVDKTLVKDLRGLKFKQLPNNHKSGDTDKIVTQVVKDYYNGIIC